MRDGLRRLREAGDTTTFEGMDPDGPLPPFITPDHLLSAVVDGGEFVEAKMRAMKAHATQIELDGPFFALSNNIGNEVWGKEFYRSPRARPARPARTVWRRICSRACDPARRSPAARGSGGARGGGRAPHRRARCPGGAAGRRVGVRGGRLAPAAR